MHASGDSEAADVFDFVDEFLTDRERGRERPLAEYLARYPRCQAAVAREYLALGTRPPEPDPSVPSEGEQRIGPYRILAEIGRGGQGAVFLAEDTRIARKVALKVLASRFDLVSEDRRRRFRREAEVIARLEHPGICGIYEADIDGDAPYIAMRYVEGRSMAQILGEARAGEPASSPGADSPDSDLSTTWPPESPLDIRRVLLLFERVARALHAAHEAGVVHRDIKPGNVMIARDGKPVLLDFGLARDEQSELATLTQSGDVFGTPAYMSPEQLTGGEVPLDRRTDVYSLAVSLYEALTLVRPFEAPSRLELYRRIGEEPLVDPRRHNPRLTEDVKVVLETALERDRERRYATSLDFAEDLRRIREYEPIRARPAGVFLRFSRWTRRHPVLAVSTIGTILTLSAGLALALHLIDKRDSALESADRSLGYALGRHLAERCVALVAEDPAVALAVGVEAAEKEIRQGGSTHGANYLTRSALFQALEACWLERVLSGEGARLATDAVLSPDGRLLALATDRSFTRIFDLETGARLLDLGVSHGSVARAFFTPDGTQMVLAAREGGVRVFDAPTGRLEREIDTGDPIVAADLSPNGESLVAVGCGGRAVVLDLVSGKRRAVLDPEVGGIEWAGFAPQDNGRLVTWASSGQSTLWDANTGRVILDLDTRTNPVIACDFDPAGHRVALGCEDGWLHVLDLPSGKPARPPLSLGAPAGFLAFSPDGTHLLVATDQDQVGEAFVIDFDTGERRRLAGHAGRRVIHGSFNPDGTQVATASFDATVRLWDVSSGIQVRVLTGRTRPVAVLWTSDGKRLVTLNNDWLANVWFTRSRPDVFDLTGHAGPVLRARFSTDGRTALTASLDATARLWEIPATSGASPRNAPDNREPGMPIHILRHDGPVTDACFSRACDSVLTTSADRTARLWNARTGEPIGRPLLHPGPVNSGSFDSGGTRVLTVCADGAVRIFAPFTEAPPITITGRSGPIVSATFDTTGALVACAGAGDSVGIWSAQDGTSVQELTFAHDAAYSGGVCALATAPDGLELAAACNDEKVRFWNVQTGTSVRENLVVFPTRGLVYSTDGSKLLVTGRFGGGAAKVFLLGRNRRTAQAEISHTRGSSIVGGVLSVDGSLVLTFAKDGSAHVWESVSGRPVAYRTGTGAAILDAAFDSGISNPRVIVARDDGSVSVWPVDPLPAARARMPRPLTPMEKQREQRLALPLRYD